MISTNIKHFIFVTFLSCVLPEILAEQTSLINMAAHIANLVYKPHHLTSIVWQRSNPEYVTEFINGFHGSLVTVEIDNNNSRIRDLNKFRQTILLAESVEEFAYFITLVNLDLIVPIRVLLVLTNPVYDLSEVTRTAWNNDVADILIMTKNESDNVTFYTYFPYNNKKCGDYTPVKLKSDVKDYFPKKFTNFYGCPIKVTLLEVMPYVKLERKNGNITSITGIDGSVLMFIIERVNASIDIVSAHGEIGSYINGTWTGSFGDLANRRADIFVPAGVISHSRHLAAQMSHVYKALDVFWYGPKRREIYAWAKVFLPLFTNTAPFTCLTFTVFVIVIVLFKRFSFHKTVTNDSVFFQAFIIFLGQNAEFETRSTIINSVFILWVWFCLILRIVYQGDLVDGLQKIVLEPRLKSLEEAIKTVDAYGGPEVFLEHYKDTFIAKNYEVLSLMDVPQYIKEISNGKRFLLVTDILLIRQVHGHVQVLDKAVVKTATCMFMRPGWPASKELDHLIHRVIELGFVEKINRATLEWMATEEFTKDSSEPKALDMSICGTCFYGLIILWFACFLVFILEIIHYKIKKNLSA